MKLHVDIGEVVLDGIEFDQRAAADFKAALAEGIRQRLTESVSQSAAPNPTWIRGLDAGGMPVGRQPDGGAVGTRVGATIARGVGL